MKTIDTPTLPKPTTYTPTPWQAKPLFGTESFVLLWQDGPRGKRVDEKGSFSEQDAAFIVRACNSHDELLEALRALHDYLCLSEGDAMDKELRAALAQCKTNGGDV